MRILPLISSVKTYLFLSVHRVLDFVDFETTDFNDHDGDDVVVIPLFGVVQHRNKFFSVFRPWNKNL
jgi:hypothetical protein